LAYRGPSRCHTGFNSFERIKKARVVFRLENLYYGLPLTDPSYAGSVKKLEVGDHRSCELGISDDQRILFTISLSEPFNGLCYKLVAAVVVVPEAWTAFPNPPRGPFSA
jgi:hypothetical protein